MKELNDSNATCFRNGVAVFTDRIDVDDDLFISSSCVFLSDVTATGTIRAQYNLTVFGALIAGSDVEIGGNLLCTQIKGNNISVSGQLTVRDDIACNNLFVANDANIGSAFCTNIEVHGILVSTGMLDATQNIDVAKSLISLDLVQANGRITAPEVVATELSADEESISKKTILEYGTTQTQAGSPVFQSIAESDISGIFDAHSSVAICVDDFAVFFERLNSHLSGLELFDEQLRRYLTAYADFFPSYADLNQIIMLITPVMEKPSIDEATWFEDFNTCVDAVIRIPEWFQKSKVSVSLHDKVLDLLSYQSTHKLSTNSYSVWSKTNYHTMYLLKVFADEPVVRAQLRQLHERLLSNISLKAPSFSLLFTKE